MRIPTHGPRAALHALRAAFLEALYPTRCAACGAPGVIWCGACRAQVVSSGGPICLACRRALPHPPGRPACPDSAPRAIAAARYQPPIDRLLTHLKYRPDPRLERALADLLRDAVEHGGVRATCIVPVPLGARRERQRGYNQAEHLGRALARSMQLPLFPSAVERIRETATQVGLDPRERQANVAGAFRADPDLVRGQSVLLVDDVHTTGATLGACADALAAAGAMQVVGATVARA